MRRPIVVAGLSVTILGVALGCAIRPRGLTPPTRQQRIDQSVAALLVGEAAAAQPCATGIRKVELVWDGAVKKIPKRLVEWFVVVPGTHE